MYRTIGLTGVLLVGGNSAVAQPAIQVEAPAKVKVPAPEIQAFLDARAKDIRAGNQEPHRAMLVALSGSKNLTERVWALGRRLESGDMSAFVPYGDALIRHIRGTVQAGSGYGDARLGGAAIIIGKGAPEATEIAPSSPFWLSLAKTLETDPSIAGDPGLYAIWCYNTVRAHRPLIERVARYIQSSVRVNHHALDPWSDPRFWIVTDWAVAWGGPGDFDRLEQIIQDPPARREFHRRFQELSEIQSFLPCLWENEKEDAANSPSRPAPLPIPPGIQAQLQKAEGAVHFEFTQLKVKRMPPVPAYPAEAQSRGLMGDLQVEITVNPSGEACMVRLRPAPFLAFFAPTCLRFSEKWAFQPAILNDVPRYARFLLNMPFRLRR